MTGRTYFKSNQAKAVKRILLLALFITLSLSMISGHALAQQGDKQHVLILNSYHQGFSWTNRIVAGIEEAFTEAGSNAEFHIEYMDTKRIYNEAYLQDIFQLLQGKYANIPIDVIILSDNNALEFMRTHGEQLFPGVPIVFAGINNYSDALLDGFDQITGIAEAIDISSTLSLMLSLHPETKQIYVLNDQTPTGIATLKDFELAKTRFADQVEFIVFDDFQINDMQQKLATLPSDSLILMLLVNRDNTGQFYTYEESLDILSLNTQVPIYGVWDFYIEHGIVGGKLTDGFGQGHIAGEMALRILQGEPAADIPVLRESPNQYMFDYEQLQRFGIDTDQLPEGSIILNKPVSLYDLYKVYIWAVALVFIILVVAIVILLRSIAQRKQAEEEMAHSNRELQTLSADLEQRVVDRTNALVAGNRVSRTLSTILDVDQLVAAVVNQLQEAFQYYHVHIYLVDEAKGNLVMVGGTGKAGETMLARGHTLESGQGLVGRAAITNKPVLVPNVAQDNSWLPNPLLPDTVAEAAIPISLGSQVFGVVDVQHNVAGKLDQDGVDLLQAIANQIAVALQNARQYQQAQENEARTRSILDSITVPLLISRVADGNMFYVNEQLAEVIRMPLDQLRVSGTPNFYVDMADRQVVVGKIQEQGFITNYELRLQRADGEQFWALLSARLIQFEGDAAIFTTLLDITDRKFFEAANEKQAYELQAVAEINTIAMSFSDIDEMLMTVINLIKEKFNLYHAHMYLLNEDGDTLLLTAGAGEAGRQMVQEQHRIKVAQERSLVARAARTAEPVLVNDVKANPDHLPNPLLPDTRAELTVPLVVGETVVGVLDVQSDKVNYFSPADVSIQSTLANQLAASIQSARALVQAERAVSQLNAITRRLTREGWDEFLRTKSSSSQIGFGYDLKQVAPVSIEDSSEPEAEVKLRQPIRIQGAEVGALNIADPQVLTDEAQEIVTAVSDRLAAHIENLRLTEQTQSALASTEALFAGSERVVRANSMQEILEALVHATGLQQLNLATLSLFDKPWHQNPEILITFANWVKQAGTLYQPPGTVNRVNELPTLKFIDEADYFYVADVDNDPRLDENTAKIFRELGVKTTFSIPLAIGEQIFGLITGSSHQLVPIDDREIRHIKSLVDQAAVVTQSLRLFEDAQSRARREQLLREVTARIHAAPDAESILRTTAQEVNRALGLEAFVYLEEPDVAHQANGMQAHGKK